MACRDALALTYLACAYQTLDYHQCRFLFEGHTKEGGAQVALNRQAFLEEGDRAEEAVEKTTEKTKEADEGEEAAEAEGAAKQTNRPKAET